MDEQALEVVRRVLREQYTEFKKIQKEAEKSPTTQKSKPQFQLISCKDGTGILFVSIQMAVFCYKLNWNQVEVLQVFRGHVDNIRTFYVDFERSKLITISRGMQQFQLRLWNIKTGEEILKEPFIFSEQYSFFKIREIRYDVDVLTFTNVFNFHHITKYMIYTCPCMMILVVLIPRLVKVDYHLPAIEMKIPQIWDWSDDTSPHRHAEHPYSSNNLEYDGVVVFVKLLLLCFTIFLGKVQNGIIASWVVLVGGIILLFAGIRYPPYYHQRDRRMFDPNCIQTGLDAAMVWLYTVGLMATYANIYGGEEALSGSFFIWMPRGVLVTLVLFYWIRLKGYVDFMEIGYSKRDVEKWKIGRVIPRTMTRRRRRRGKKVVVGDMEEEEEEKKKLVEKNTATKVEFVKVDIRTPRRRKSQLIQNGKVKFTKLDEEEG